MKRTVFLANTLLFCLLGATVSHAQQRVPVSNAPYPVSIIKLLATPDFYHGKKVAIEGYLHNKFEDSALYFTRDHADRLMGYDAVWVRYKPTLSDSLKVDLKTFDEKYVRIVVFNKY